MSKENKYLDHRGDFTAPSEGTADYPKKPKHEPVNINNKEKK
jgi:hypothetical protein